MELIGFLVLTALALVSALVVILHRNQVIAALSLAANLVAIAGFYLLLNAQFLAVLQVIVYAGAIMVLILFVIMLLNLREEASRKIGRSFQRGFGLVLAAALVAILGAAAARATSGAVYPGNGSDFGTVASVGNALFSSYFYAFEAISLLLIVAMIGAVLLAKRRV